MSTGDGGLARTMQVGRRMRTLVAIAFALAFVAALAPVGGAAPAHPSTSSAFLAVTDAPKPLTLHSAFTVSAEVVDPADVQSVYFTFCQITYGVCYLPTTMTPESAGSQWYSGTTQVISKYAHMAVGVHAGFNITVFYTNSTNTSIPDSTGGQPESFSNLTAVQAVAPGEFYFQVVVEPTAYGVSGVVTNSTSGAPLAGANVSLNSTNVTAVTSAANGSYALTNVPSGNYTLTVARTGYTTSTQKIEVGSSALVENVPLSAVATNHHAGGSPSGSSDTFFGLPATEAFAVIGVAAIAVIALLFLAMRPKRGAPAPADPESFSPPPMPPKGSQ
jgi:CarboxypepD_reg-like domain